MKSISTAFVLHLKGLLCHAKVLIQILLVSAIFVCASGASAGIERRLYVLVDAADTKREPAQVLIYDINHRHRLIDQFALPLAGAGRGICASTKNNALYVSVDNSVSAFDLKNHKLIWKKSYPGIGDRLDITKDSEHLLLPSGWYSDRADWFVLDPKNGHIENKIRVAAHAHNTLAGPGGQFAYLSSIKSSYLTVIDTKNFRTVKSVGPFSDAIRPFVINGTETRVYASVDNLLGFEIADLNTGKKLKRVEVGGYPVLKPKKHQPCPSHGIALTRDNREIWIVNNGGKLLHVFDHLDGEPILQSTIILSSYPGWINFSINGEYAYPSTGDIIDTASKKREGALKDATGNRVESEKLLEIDFDQDQPVEVGRQYGIGR